LLLPHDAPREDWLRMRATGIGSSDIAAIVGASEYRHVQHIWYDKTGALPLDDDAGEAALWGTLFEDQVAAEWARRNHSAVEPIGIVHSVDNRAWLCSLDRRVTVCPLNRDQVKVCALEVKTRNAYVAGDWNRSIPDDVHAQAAWQMVVTGFDHIHVACLIGGQELRQYVVRHDDEIQHGLVQAAVNFWEMVQKRYMPSAPAEFNHPEYTVDLLNRVYPDRDGVVEVSKLDAMAVIEQYDSASEVIKQMTRVKNQAKADMLEMLGGKVYATVDGYEVFNYKPRRQAPAVDLDQLAERWPDAFEACVSEKSGPVISIKKAGRSL
jgi:putative phage-type endonuclease